VTGNFLGLTATNTTLLPFVTSNELRENAPKCDKLTFMKYEKIALIKSVFYALVCFISGNARKAAKSTVMLSTNNDHTNESAD